MTPLREAAQQALEALINTTAPKNWEVITALKTALAEPGHPAIPLENSREAADAIEATLAEYGHPTNPVNAARAGWRAARLYTAPQQRNPVGWDGRCMLGHCNSPAGCENSGECRAVERAHGIKE